MVEEKIWRWAAVYICEYGIAKDYVCEVIDYDECVKCFCTGTYISWNGIEIDKQKETTK